MSAGAYQAPSRKTVSEVLDAWLSGPAAQTVRPQTLVSYRSVLNTYVLKVKPGGGITPLADRPIRSLTLADIDGLYAELRAPVTTKDAGGAETTAPRLSPRTVRYLHAILRSALHYAVRNRLIPHNPSDGATLPRQERGEITALDATLARAFLDATKDDRWHALFTLRLIGRLRPGEALALSLERHRVGRD